MHGVMMKGGVGRPLPPDPAGLGLRDQLLSTKEALPAALVPGLLAGESMAIHFDTYTCRVCLRREGAWTRGRRPTVMAGPAPAQMQIDSC